MPLTDLQRRLLALLARSTDSDRYLAGGTALHLASESSRFSEDLDFFHDSAEAVAESFARDSAALEAAGYRVHVRLSQPGFIQAIVEADDRESTRIDWAHDSAWRFMPLVRLDDGGLALHEVDLAINKVLTLAGREEARDFVDILHAHEHILPLGALIWAAVAKDPGFTPPSLLEQLKRRGRYRPEEIDRIELAAPVDLVEAKAAWRAALSDADKFIRERPHDEAGCLYYSPSRDCFVAPSPGTSLKEQGLVPHFGQSGGILPRVADTRPTRRHGLTAPAAPSRARRRT
ncbi:MAG: nucleotidyl transferase AbiEii/AbiGii toxin family protein [Gemmatimonadota bacterium]|nr:nucleotidyl transferase AbiEii/AbiGii toxin family protein [Gemmatimonadota bacterium]MDE2985745.1 nucleotidyl transferase AbiEii/AbiGii toxin family protein [Gemmatimonadota bacterium]